MEHADGYNCSSPLFEENMTSRKPVATPRFGRRGRSSLNQLTRNGCLTKIK